MLFPNPHLAFSQQLRSWREKAFFRRLLTGFLQAISEFLRLIFDVVCNSFLLNDWRLCMLNLERLFCLRQKRRNLAGESHFSREITLALAVKFCLLGILWWTFFAGQKVPVDAGGVAHVMLNVPLKH